jgi:hypothetical protein
VASIGAAISEVQSTVTTFKETVQATANKMDATTTSFSTPKTSRSHNRRHSRQGPPHASSDYFGDTEDDIMQISKVQGSKSPKINKFHVCIVHFTHNVN